MVTLIRDAQIDSNFPAAANDGYALTSDPDPDYNCIAWATHETDINWWPSLYPKTGWYWPPGIPVEATVEAFIAAYGTRGWLDCGTDGSLEVGFEKLAIYVGPLKNVLHAARQLQDGAWTSKLGQYRDISHTTPAAIESSNLGQTAYGVVDRYMKRPRS